MKKIGFVIFALGLSALAQTPTSNELVTLAESFYGVKDCDLKRPDVNCLEKLLIPLSSAQDILPFDVNAVLGGVNEFGPFVAPSWQITTLHRLPLQFNVGNREACVLEEFKFLEEPVSYPGCGTFLFLGGHPLLKKCQDQGKDGLDCLNSIEISQRPDIALRFENEMAAENFLPAAELLEGEEVFIVHRPLFSWLDSKALQDFRSEGLFVTKAQVLQKEGRVAVLLATVFQGSSGGTVLNSKGQVVGILTAGDKDLPVAIAQILDLKMLEMIETAKSVSAEKDQ